MLEAVGERSKRLPEPRRDGRSQRVGGDGEEKEEENSALIDCEQERQLNWEPVMGSGAQRVFPFR